MNAADGYVRVRMRVTCVAVGAREEVSAAGAGLRRVCVDSVCACGLWCEGCWWASQLLYRCITYHMFKYKYMILIVISVYDVWRLQSIRALRIDLYAPVYPSVITDLSMRANTFAHARGRVWVRR
jgi:hypothetical protein